ncbi:sensor histidine kinase [Luteitalea sp. TBR-22]|uniref:sensor histidine kinase n=1 Tax=Luteitalea sp. TBR-22 TaxID=2802971 RepID=UPI001EF47348|nr:sensor histidine kinase [Luteitalea sp. TBR-22]
MSAFLQRKYQDRRFDLIVTMHDVALQFVGSHRDELFPNVPVVFASTDRNVKRLPDSTGVIAPNALGGTLTLSAALQPERRHVFVVSGADRRDAAFEREARGQFAAFTDRFTFTYLSGLPPDELRTRVSALPADALIYYLLVNRDNTGVSHHPLHYLDLLAAAANAPVYSWVESAMGRGIVGGGLRSQARQIEILGDLAVRVLRGQPAGTIPLVSADLTVSQVDWRQLRRWHIDQGRLPVGTVVKFETPSAWDRYKPYIVVSIVLMLLQTTLIGALMVQLRRRWRAEQHATESQTALKQSYDRIRDLAGRLLTAHEEERARIARELHDDISQQLALLWNDLEFAGGVADAGLGAANEHALVRLQGITRSVRDLSHRLHPAKLRLLGLVPSLHALAREMSMSGLKVTVHAEHMPLRLAPELALCLYRIVQEALQNAARHGQAHEARIHLAAHQGEMTLEVQDDGIGFDPHSVQSSGLGLMSMRERLDAVGGHLELHSRRGAGTTLRVLAPVRPADPEAAAG